MHIERDGVRIACREAGSGEPILFIHCWGGDHRFFAPQIDHFARGHRVVVPDLRGHGESDARAGLSFAIDDLVADLAHLCRALELSRPWVVGHSMGGNLALELAARHPELARGVVLLDSAVVMPAALAQAWQPVLAGIETPAHAEVMRAFTGQVGGFVDDPARRAWLLDHMAAQPQHVLLATLRAIAAHDSDAAAARVRAPLLYVAAGAFCDLERLRRHCPQLLVGQVVGSGHYLPLEVPEQVNAMIDRFVALSRHP